MQVTWWMPGTLAGTDHSSEKVENGPIYVIGRRLWSTAGLGSAGLVVLGRLLFDHVPDLGRERLPHLFLDVPDQPDGTGHHRQPAAHPPWDLELAGDRF